MRNVLSCLSAQQLGKELNFCLKVSLEADPSGSWNEDGVLIRKGFQDPTWAKEEHHPCFTDQWNDIPPPPVSEEGWCSCRSLMTWQSAPIRKLLGKRGPRWGQMLVSVGSMESVGCLKITRSIWLLQGVFLFSLSCLLLLLCHYQLSSFLPTPLHCFPFLPLPQFLCSRSVEAWKKTQMAGPVPQSFWSVAAGLKQRACSSNKCPADCCSHQSGVHNLRSPALLPAPSLLNFLVCLSTSASISYLSLSWSFLCVCA